VKHAKKRDRELPLAQQQTAQKRKKKERQIYWGQAMRAQQRSSRSRVKRL
jgi:hypothetical protein